MRRFRWLAALGVLGCVAVIALGAPRPAAGLTPIPEYLCYLRAGGLYRAMPGGAEETLVVPASIPTMIPGFAPPFEIVDYSWAPTGKRLVFLARTVGKGEGRLFLADQNGQEVVPITGAHYAPFRVSGDIPDIAVSWSADGARFACAGTTGDPTTPEGFGGCAVIDSVSGKPIWSGLSVGPCALSPRGDEVAYSPLAAEAARGAPGQSETSFIISEVPASSTDPTRSVAEGVEPLWSPDGRSIAYMPLGVPGLSIVGADGGEAATLTSMGLGRVTFSPDGVRLFFLAEAEEGTQSLYSVPADGSSGPARVADGATDYALDSDGAHVAYATHGGVFIRSTDGSGTATKLTPDELDASVMVDVCTSPGDRYIAFRESAGGTGPVRLWEAVGERGTEYTSVVATDVARPMWQPYPRRKGGGGGGTSTTDQAGNPLCSGLLALLGLGATGAFVTSHRPR